MPAALAFDDDEVTVRVEPGVEGPDDLVGHDLFNLLPLAIA